MKKESKAGMIIGAAALLTAAWLWWKGRKPVIEITAVDDAAQTIFYKVSYKGQWHEGPAALADPNSMYFTLGDWTVTISTNTGTQTILVAAGKGQAMTDVFSTAVVFENGGHYISEQ